MSSQTLTLTLTLTLTITFTLTLTLAAPKRQRMPTDGDCASVARAACSYSASVVPCSWHAAVRAEPVEVSRNDEIPRLAFMLPACHS
eukprot:5594531-Pleurochrysis_carterae.AAC.1